MEFGAELETVRFAEAQGELLPQGDIGHREFPVEGDLLRPAVFVVHEGPLEIEEFRIAVRRQDRRRSQPLAEHGVQPQGAEIARSVGNEVETLRFRLPLLGELRVLAAAKADGGQPGPVRELPSRLQLRIEERRKVLVEHPADDHIVVSAAAGQQETAGARQRPLDHQVAVGDAERGSGRQVRPAGPVLDDQQRREPVAVRRAETSGGKGETLHGFRVEGADQSEEAIGVVDLHAVHEREVLVRSPAAHGEPAAEVLGGGHSRKRRESAEDVVRGPGDFEHFRRRDDRGRRPGEARSGGGDLDLFRDPPGQHPHGYRPRGAFRRQGRPRLEVALGGKGQSGRPRRQRDRESAFRIGGRRPAPAGHRDFRDRLPRDRVPHDAPNLAAPGLRRRRRRHPAETAGEGHRSDHARTTEGAASLGVAHVRSDLTRRRCRGFPAAPASSGPAPPVPKAAGRFPRRRRCRLLPIRP